MKNPTLMNIEDISRYWFDQEERLILMRMSSIASLISSIVGSALWVSSNNVP